VVLPSSPTIANLAGIAVRLVAIATILLLARRRASDRARRRPE
jgi:nitrate reductase gamma subunit